MPDRAPTIPVDLAAITQTFAAALDPIGRTCRQALAALTPEFWSVVEAVNMEARRKTEELASQRHRQVDA